MSSPAHYYKLGLFIIVASLAALGTVLMFGVVSVNEKVRYHTFFDESVQGLELGAPVKFRGVTVGHVATIAIAADHQHVQVVSELDVEGARQMTLRAPGAPPAGKAAPLALPPGLRAQLATQGITGVKFVAMDLFDPTTHPPPELSFDPPERYIPATPSMLKSLEDIAARALARMPEMTEAVLSILSRIDRVLGTLERSDVTAEAVKTLRHADDVLTAMQSTITHLDRAHVGEKAAATLDELQRGATKLNGVLARLDGEAGLVAAATRATESLGAIGRGGRRTQRDLEGTLRDVSDAADAIRSLAKALERDPEMLLKGKAEGKAFK